MKACRCVILDPTGNLTALVLDPVAPDIEAFLTGKLLKESEQVAYLEPPSLPGAEAAIRLMGGEFCGNASMAAATWLLREHLAEGEERTMLLQVSGAEKPVPCRVRKTESGYQGTVLMPPVLDVCDIRLLDRPFTAVRMEGILHLIFEGAPMEKREAENLLARLSLLLPDEAIGLLQWNRNAGWLDPLVFVRGSGSMVWEHGCGSGSAAVGACEALRNGEGLTATAVHQPGGTITAAAEVRNHALRSVRITGTVRLGQEKTMQLS